MTLSPENTRKVPAEKACFLQTERNSKDSYMRNGASNRKARQSITSRYPS